MGQERAIRVRLTLSAMALVLLMAGSAAGLGCKSNSGQAKSVQAFAGMSEQDARAALEEAGLSLEVVYQPGPDDQIGVVIGQDPASGQKLEEATTITLTIGIKQQVEVPDLAGLTQDEAAAKLAGMGLNANPSAQDTDQEAQAGLVLTQEPAVGTKVDKESQVAITVGNYVPVASTTTTTGSQSSGTSGGNNPSYATCPVCGGSGTTSEPSPPKRSVCPTCGGPANNPNCSNCGGSGYVTTSGGPSSTKTCSACGGSGKIRQ